MRLSNQTKRNQTQMLNMNGWLYWVYLGILCIMLYVRDVMRVNIPLPVFLAYFAVAYMTMDFDHSLAITGMLPLLNHGVQTNYIVIMAILAYLYKYGGGLRMNAVHGIVAALMVLELLHVGYVPFSIAEYLRYAAQYIYLALILGEIRMKKLLKNPEIVLRTFIFIAVYFMIDVILVTSQYIALEKVLTGQFRFGVLDEFFAKKATLYDNENMVGMFALMAINFLAISMIKTKKHLIRDGFLVGYFIYFGLLTQSKTFLICLALSAALYSLYWLYVERKSAGKMLLIILGVALAVYIALTVIFPDVMVGVLQRFEAADLGTGRSELFQLYNEVILESPMNFMFGIGLQSVREKTGIWNTPHNGLQEAMVCWGVVGLILVLCLFVSFARRAPKYVEKKVAFCYYIPAIAFFVVIQTMQFVRLSAIFMMLVPLFIGIYMGGVSHESNTVPDHC